MSPLARNVAAVPSRIRLADLLGGLSMVADLGFGLPPQTAMRSCLVATATARRLGLSEPEVHDTYYVALLMHIGCVALSHETSVAFGDELVTTRAVALTNLGDPDDYERTLLPAITAGRSEAATRAVGEYLMAEGLEFGRRYDSGACEVARATARRIGLPESVQRGLYEEAEWWAGGSAPQGLAGDDIAISARVARAAADAAFLADVRGLEGAVAGLRARAGTVLDPAVVDVIAGDPEGLVSDAVRGEPRDRILEEEPTPVIDRDPGDLVSLAAAFGDVGDLKAPFLHGHSAAVAALATAAGERAASRGPPSPGCRSPPTCTTSDGWRVQPGLGKPGPLTRSEWERVRLHAYHSERILATSQQLEEVAPIAGMHHERVDASGYHRGSAPRHPGGGAAPRRRRRDAAMTEARPHRDALTPEAGRGRASPRGAGRAARR